jgi:hypothetical protein
VSVGLSRRRSPSHVGDAAAHAAPRFGWAHMRGSVGPTRERRRGKKKKNETVRWQHCVIYDLVGG